MNGLTTAITVLADERVWDKTNYPDYNPNPSIEPIEYGNGVQVVPSIHIVAEPYENWVERIGGKKNEVLRNLISSKRLAN